MDIGTSESSIRNNFTIQIVPFLAVLFLAYVLKVWKSSTDQAHYKTLELQKKNLVIISIEEQQTCVYGACPETRNERIEMQSFEKILLLGICILPDFRNNNPYKTGFIEA